jgi:hypothetical protein
MTKKQDKPCIPLTYVICNCLPIKLQTILKHVSYNVNQYVGVWLLNMEIIL